MQPSPSWEAASRLATQEFPNILWNPKGHYLCSEDPYTGPYLEPHESSPYIYNCIFTANNL
jgi:hypothetical protein